MTREEVFCLSHTHTRPDERNSLVLHIGLDDDCRKEEEREREKETKREKDESECHIVVVAMT